MFPFSRNKNQPNSPTSEYREPQTPSASPESTIATDVYYRTLSAVATMEEIGIAPGETIEVSISPAATKLGAAILRTEISAISSRAPLVSDVSNDIATVQYL